MRLGAAEASPSTPIGHCGFFLVEEAFLEHCKAGLTVLGLGKDLLREPKGNSNRQKEELGLPARMLGAKAP